VLFNPKFLLASGSLVFISCPNVLAQSNIVPDNTLGNESSVVNVSPDNPLLDLITGGAQRGQNLFHSFEQFNVTEGRGAYFTSPSADIVNILSRITGNNISEIFGTLGTNGASQPNLFLINPNGIVFGENASLNVGGSFYASTVSSIVFENGEFSATNVDDPPLLTINMPIGLNFGNNPGDIINLSVANGVGLVEFPV
jgi:filamentous hemagglutinin family protein